MGRANSNSGVVQDIQLNGSYILDEHCLFNNNNGGFLKTIIIAEVLK